MPDVLALFSGKRVTVMGLGLLGRGLRDTLFLIQCGAEVTVTDMKTAEELAPSVEKLKGLPCKMKLGGHDPDDFTNADMILRGAGVPRSSPFLRIAVERGILVEMDESLFCRHFQGQVVGVTGTRGKTTTAFLVHRILSAHRSGVRLAGNVMGRATLPLLQTAGTDDTVVLELSSWQLQGFHDARMSPHAAIFTNIHPDHLDKYENMAEYIEDKKAIYRYQTNGDFCIFNGDQPETACLAEEAPAGTGFFRAADVPKGWQVKLRGDHNRANVAAAVTLARRLDVPEGVIRNAVEAFKGVEHRLQWLGEKNGVAFINDSASTTPVAGCAALDSIPDRRLLLIAGGSDKKLDLRAFAGAAAGRCARIALLKGAATETLREAIMAQHGAEKILGPFSNLRTAVEALMEEAVPGDVVLLSPGCASFGMFQNEYDRGDQFIGIVNEILA